MRKDKCPFCNEKLVFYIEISDKAYKCPHNCYTHSRGVISDLIGVIIFDDVYIYNNKPITKEEKLKVLKIKKEIRDRITYYRENDRFLVEYLKRI